MNSSRRFRVGGANWSQTGVAKEFVKDVGGCPVQVAVFKTAISFSVPCWKNSEAAVFEALQDVAELCDFGNMVILNPQTGEWTDG